MHECLRRGALQNLPISIRRYAQAAASGSTEHVERVVKVMTELENRPQLVHLLPVIYPPLDPARIPKSDADHLAKLTPAEKIAYRETMLAFDALSWMENMPREVGPQIWSRLWRWFGFLELYYLVHGDEASDGVICSQLISVANFLERDPEMGSMVRSTPGFYSLVSRAWIAALHLTQSSGDDLEYNFDGILRLYAVAKFLSDHRALRTKETLEVFIGGHDPSVLAMWALRHGDFALKLIGESPPKKIGFAILLVLPAFVHSVQDAAENLDINEPPSRLLVELVDHGIIDFLTRTVHALATNSAWRTIGGSLAQTISTSWYCLARLFEDHRFNSARNTIFVALIRCAAVCAQQRDLADMSDHLDLKGGLSMLLASCTIHWGDRSGRDVVRILATYEQTIPKFAPEVKEAWTSFVVLANDRADFADSFDPDGIVNMKACDNTLTVDWRSGHRDACKTHDYQLSGRLPFLTSRKRAFARAILHRDYMNRKPDVFVDAVGCMRASGNPRAGYFVVFDYSEGEPELGVFSFAQPSNSLKWLSEAGIQWDKTVERAARSGGRMTIYVMRIREGRAPRHWVVPLRSSSGMVHETLLKMACAEEGETQLQDFEDLVDISDSEVVEFH